MKYQNLEYTQEQTIISCLLNGKPTSVPVNSDNADYQEIMRLVEAGELTIAEPD